MKQLNVGNPYVSNIINTSIKKVFTQLNQMPSRTYRKEEGVGTLKDLHKRCEPIANNWKISEPKAAPAPANVKAKTKKAQHAKPSKRPAAKQPVKR